MRLCIMCVITMVRIVMSVVSTVMMGFWVLVVAFFAVEHQEIHPEGIKGRDENT